MPLQNLAKSPILFAILSLGYILLAIIAVSSAAAIPLISVKSFILLLVILNLLAENIILAFGKSLENRNLLIRLSKVRYLLHALSTPMLLPLSLYILNINGSDNFFAVEVITWIVSIGWILLSLSISFRKLNLRLQHDGEIYRYININKSGQPYFKIALILLILIYLGFGLAVYSSYGLLIIAGAISMLVGNGLSRKLGIVTSNIGEFLFMSSVTMVIS